MRPKMARGRGSILVDPRFWVCRTIGHTCRHGVAFNVLIRHEQPETLLLVRVQGSGLGLRPQVSGVPVGREVAVDHLIGAGGHVMLGEKQVSFYLSNDVFGDAGVGGDLRNVGRAGAYSSVSSFFCGT